MEKLPLAFVQSSIEQDIQECFTPAFNFTKLQSSNGRLAFINDKVYWLPDSPMAMMDQGWVINVSEIESCGKYGISGFSIKLVDGTELRFSNVGQKMREGITEAIESHKEDVAAETPATEPAPAADAPAAPVAPVAPEAAPAKEEAKAEAASPEPATEFDPADVSSNKLVSVYSKFARFHVNQGLILLICSIVCYAIGKIPGLAFVYWILSLAILILAIIGIVNVVKGQAKELPIIGKYKILS